MTSRIRSNSFRDWFKTGTRSTDTLFGEDNPSVFRPKKKYLNLGSKAGYRGFESGKWDYLAKVIYYSRKPFRPLNWRRSKRVANMFRAIELRFCRGFKAMLHYLLWFMFIICISVLRLFFCPMLCFKHTVNFVLHF